jgi:hypothetical protein
MLKIKAQTLGLFQAHSGQGKPVYAISEAFGCNIDDITKNKNM